MTEEHLKPPSKQIKHFEINEDINELKLHLLKTAFLKELLSLCVLQSACVFLSCPTVYDLVFPFMHQ